MDDVETQQMVLVSQTTVDPDLGLGRIALFDENGDPIATDDLVKATPPTGEDVLLTGYEAGSAEAVAATDTVNEAVAKLEAQAAVEPTAADVVLTGYVLGDALGDLTESDSVNDALAKLESRIAALEAPS
jgi:hypothetical protein